MFNFKLALLNMFFKFNVVSDLPGRMRIKVNNYKKLPQDAQKYQNYAVEAIKRLDGITNVSFNFVIGTILIEYDTDKISSKEIVDWINHIKELIGKNIDYINSISNRSEEEICNELFRLLDENMK